MVLAFVLDLAALRRKLASTILATATAGRLWICWPKRSSGVATGLTENMVREHGLAAGIVDIKACAIDDTWSGLCPKAERSLRHSRSLPASVVG